MSVSEQDYICKKCNEPIVDIAKAMVEGCNCGSRLFKKGTLVEDELPPELETKPIETDANVAIHVKQRGVYELNLENLTKRESKTDPIFVQDSKGKINVIFNPET